MRSARNLRRQLRDRRASRWTELHFERQMCTASSRCPSCSRTHGRAIDAIASFLSNHSKRRGGMVEAPGPPGPHVDPGRRTDAHPAPAWRAHGRATRVEHSARLRARILATSITIPFDGGHAPREHDAPGCTSFADLGYADVWSQETTAPTGSPRSRSPRPGAATRPWRGSHPGRSPRASAARPIRGLDGRGCAGGAVQRSGWGRRASGSCSAGTASPTSSRARGLATCCASCSRSSAGEKVDVRVRRRSRSRCSPHGAAAGRPPEILLGALRPGHAATGRAPRPTARRSSTGSSAEDVGRLREEVGVDKQLAARIFVDPEQKTPMPRATSAGGIVAAYLNVEAYAALESVARRWWEPAADGEARHRRPRGHARATPTRWHDALVLHRSMDSCRRPVAGAAARPAWRMCRDHHRPFSE